MKPKFAAGRNIAMKVPPHAHEATVNFYRDVLGLKLLENHLPHIGFEFGGKQLWIDKEAGVVRCDAIEPLPETHEDFWIADPASIVLHLGAQRGEW